MKQSLFRKIVIRTMLLGMVLCLLVGQANAFSHSGSLIDLHILEWERIVEELISADFVSADAYNVSEEPLSEEPGTVFVNIEDYSIKLIGSNSYRTYVFNEGEDAAFILLSSSFLYLLDTHNSLEYGVQVFTVNEGKTNPMSQEELSKSVELFLALF